MERKLPTISIAGTDFIVDVNKLELREKSNPNNVMSILAMTEVTDGYRFEYSLNNKNFSSLFERKYAEVTIPQLVTLDPEGMALKCGVALDQVKAKTDFDLMNNSPIMEIQSSKEMLPTLDIAGHIFYVDISMNMLRPKDGPSSEGISFNEIFDFEHQDCGMYNIPYNTSTKKYEELDFDTITQLPKDVIAVEFPLEKDLDPTAWEMRAGWPTNRLRLFEPKQHFQAKIIPWEETGILKIIKENQEQQGQHLKDREQSKELEQVKRKGRKM